MPLSESERVKCRNWKKNFLLTRTKETCERHCNCGGNSVCVCFFFEFYMLLLLLFWLTSRNIHCAFYCYCGNYVWSIYYWVFAHCFHIPGLIRRSSSLLPSASRLHRSIRISRVALISSSIWLLIWIPVSMFQIHHIVFMPVDRKEKMDFSIDKNVHTLLPVRERNALSYAYLFQLLGLQWTHPKETVTVYCTHFTSLRCAPLWNSIVCWISKCAAIMKPKRFHEEQS